MKCADLRKLLWANLNLIKDLLMDIYKNCICKRVGTFITCVKCFLINKFDSTKIF